MPDPIDRENKGKHALYKNRWVVFCKAPHNGQNPEKLVAYLSHYINRVAISNDRILNAEGHKVEFSYKDYRDSKQKTMGLGTDEFIRRFLLHVLPKGFRKIRYYGILSNRKKRISFFCMNISIGNYDKKQEVPSGWQEIYMIYYGKKPLMLCPDCKQKMLRRKVSSKPIRAGPDKGSEYSKKFFV